MLNCQNFLINQDSVAKASLSRSGVRQEGFLERGGGGTKRLRGVIVSSKDGLDIRSDIRYPTNKRRFGR